MTEIPSRARLFFARSVVVLMVGFVAVGFVLYGFSADVRERIWQNLLERPTGPMTFRFILQPVMATIAATFDAVGDARTGRSPYLWTILTDPAERVARLREGLSATARVLLLGLAMDLIYQYVEFDAFYPAESVIVAVLLAFVPYLLLRGPIARIVRWRRSGSSADDTR